MIMEEALEANYIRIQLDVIQNIITHRSIYLKDLKDEEWLKGSADVLLRNLNSGYERFKEEIIKCNFFNIP